MVLGKCVINTLYEFNFSFYFSCFSGGFLSVVYTQIFLEVLDTVPDVERAFLVGKFHAAEPFFFLPTYKEQELELSTYNQRSEKFHRWVSVKSHFFILNRLWT